MGPERNLRRSPGSILWEICMAPPPVPSLPWESYTPPSGAFITPVWLRGGVYRSAVPAIYSSIRGYYVVLRLNFLVRKIEGFK